MPGNRGFYGFPNMPTPTMVNYAAVAYGALATGISVFSGNVAQNVLDGNDATYWASASNPVADDWIYVDLGVQREISRVRLFQFPVAGSWGATQYRVQWSNDGSTWTTIRTHTPAGADETYLLMGGGTIMARYFRFYAVTGGGAAWQIYTIELWGDLSPA